MDSVENALEAKEKMFRIPPWAVGWVVPPDMPHAMSCLQYHGTFAVASVLFPTVTQMLNGAGLFICMAKTSNRGAPPLKRDDAGQIAEIRTPPKQTVFMSIFCAIAAMLTGFMQGSFLAANFPAVMGMESWRAMSMQMHMMIVSLFISTWRNVKKSKGKDPKAKNKGW